MRKYELMTIYHVEDDNITMDDLPEVPAVLGKLVLDKTADEMQYYLDNGVFPADDGEAPIRRRESSASTSRRTPATTSRRERF